MICFDLQLLLWGFAVSGVGTTDTWRCEHPGRRRIGERHRPWDASPTERADHAKRLGGSGVLPDWWGLPYVELTRERNTTGTRRVA